MRLRILETLHAFAEAVKAAKPGVIAAYPITPQTPIVERLAEFVANGELKSEFMEVEDEFGAISACLGASAAGVRTYTASSAQGLALMHEVLFIVSGLRLPVCMGVINRAMSAPINIWCDHQDSISQRDTGWLQFYVETAQEAFDLTLMQFKISEHAEVLLPSMVCADGFTLSHLYEPLAIPPQEEIDDFLGDFKPAYPTLDPQEPVTLGAIASPEYYMEIKYTQVSAMEASKPIIEEVFEDYSKRFELVPALQGSRPERYEVIETYGLEDADAVIIAMGSVCGTLKELIDELRREGKRVGLLKLRVYRPFPEEELRKSLEGIERVGVLERAVSPGGKPPLYLEVQLALREWKVRSFISGLGGRDITFSTLRKIVDLLLSGKGKEVEWIFG